MARPSDDVLRRIAEFTLSRPAEAFPEEVLARAALLLLDTLGVAAAAAPMEAARIARETAVALFGAGPTGMGARLLFDGRGVSVAGAAFAGATQIDNLDGHDGYSPTKGHIGVAAVPALAALAAGAPDLTGPEALATLVVGYEIAGRAGIALHASVSDYHTSGAWNALGVAAMAARMRRMSPEQLRQALGIAEYHGPRSQMMREIANPTMLHDGSGWGALAGMTAAVLAEAGFTGAPAVTVEASDAAAHWADLGDFWQSLHQYVKPYPVCRWAHAAIDAAEELAERHGFVPEEIAEIRIGSFDNAVALYPGMPETTSQAQYSLPFAVASRLVHGRLGLAEIEGEALGDPRTARLVSLTRMQAEPRHEARYPEGRWADVAIELTGGRILHSGDVHARGGPERPMADAEVVAKFDAYARPVLGRARADGLRDAVLALPGAGSRFADVARHLHDPVRV